MDCFMVLMFILEEAMDEVDPSWRELAFYLYEWIEVEDWSCDDRFLESF
jgi:hypothetical protein